MDIKNHMSRPKPVVLKSHVDEETGRGYEITEADAYYMVLYKGHAFNLKQWADWHTKDFLGQIGPKYPRTCFAHAGHCIRLANKLNAELETTDFTVVRLRGNVAKTVKSA